VVGLDSLTAADLAADAVGTAESGGGEDEIADGSVETQDLADGSVTGTDVNEATLGFPGATEPFSGQIGTISTSPDWKFAGGTALLATNGDQTRVTVSASATLEIASGNEFFNYQVCSRPSGGAVEMLAPPFSWIQTGELTTTLAGFSASSSDLLAPNTTYEVGFCVQKTAGQSITGAASTGFAMRTG
jgi:hypothetical protein